MDGPAPTQKSVGQAVAVTALDAFYLVSNAENGNAIVPSARVSFLTLLQFICLEEFLVVERHD